MSICEGCRVFSPSASIGNYSKYKTKKCDICGDVFKSKSNLEKGFEDLANGNTISEKEFKARNLNTI